MKTAFRKPAFPACPDLRKCGCAPLRNGSGGLRDLQATADQLRCQTVPPLPAVPRTVGDERRKTSSYAAVLDTGQRGARRQKHRSAGSRMPMRLRVSSRAEMATTMPFRSIHGRKARSIRSIPRLAKITDIALQPGEALTGAGPIAAGDTARWIIGDTTSGSGEEPQVHILVKPTRPDHRDQSGRHHRPAGLQDRAALR